MTLQQPRQACWFCVSVLGLLLFTSQGWGQMPTFRSWRPSTGFSRTDSVYHVPLPIDKSQTTERIAFATQYSPNGQIVAPYSQYAQNTDTKKQTPPKDKGEKKPKTGDKKKDDGKKDAEKDGEKDDSLFACQKWTIEAGVAGFVRSQPNRVALVLDNASSAAVINTDDIRFDYKLGLFANATRSLGAGAIELGYLGAFEWKNLSGIEGDLNLLGPGFQLAVNPGVFVAQTESALHCADIAYRMNTWDCWSWNAGFRYVRFDDRLTISELNAPFPNALDVDCDNNLYGFHLGAQWSVFDHGLPLRLKLSAGAGIYGTDTRQMTVSSFLGPAVQVSDLGTAFSGEMGLLLTYKLSEHCQISGGYRFLGFSGIALAPEQIAGTDMSTSQADIQYGTMFLHGAHLGVKFSW